MQGLQLLFGRPSKQVNFCLVQQLEHVQFQISISTNVQWEFTQQMLKSSANDSPSFSTFVEEKLRTVESQQMFTQQMLKIAANG